MDVEKLAEELSQLTQADVKILDHLLRQQYKGIVMVLHRDTALSGTGSVTPDDSIGPGTGPGH